MSVYLLAWIASAMYGLEGLLVKVLSRHSIRNPWLLNFVWQFFILLGIAILALWFSVGVPVHWMYIILASLAYALASIFNTLAIYKLDISVIAPLFSFRTAMAVLVGALFLGEILTSGQYLLIAVIFTGGIFVSVDEEFHLRSFFNRRIVLALLSMVFLVAMAAFIKKAMFETSFWEVSFWMALLAQIWMCATIPLFKNDFKAITPKRYGAIVVIAVAGVIGTLAANAAYAINVSIAATIISLPLSMVVAFLASRFAPGLLEKHTLKVYTVRFIAAAVMIIAALNL